MIDEIGRLKTIPTTAMRGTDNAALEADWTAALATILGNFSAARIGYLDELAAANLPADVDAIITATAKPEIIANIFDYDMGYWTEVDVPGRVTIDYANERIAIVDLDNDEDVYIYKATDANVTDFILDFEFQVLNTTVGGSIFFIGLADGLGSAEDVANGLYMRAYFTGVNNTAVGILHMTGGSKLQSRIISSLADDTTYYGRLIRRGSYCWLAIYSDRIRETHVTGSPVEYKDVTPAPFTHLYPVAAENSGEAAKAMDAYVERIKLISAPDIEKYLGRHVE
jgi:hypothetical protein